MRTIIPIMAAALATACVADLELGDPEVRSVCLGDAPLEFAGDGDSEARADFDLSLVDLEAPQESRVTLGSASMTAAAGVPDLAFAERVRVSLEDAPAGPIAIADAYVSGRASVELSGDPDVDLAEHLREGASRLRVAVMGDGPADRWTAMADLCFEVRRD